MQNWFRGHRSTAPINIKKLRDLEDFDNSNPNCSYEARENFYHGIIAQLDKDYGLAKIAYNKVLDDIPDEPNTIYNLNKLR